jgi:hypothetical protein
MFGVSTSKHFKQFIMCQNASAFDPRSLVVGDALASDKIKGQDPFRKS